MKIIFHSVIIIFWDLKFQFYQIPQICFFSGILF